MQIYDEEKNLIFDKQNRDVPKSLPAGVANRFPFLLSKHKIKKWSAETPYLYEIHVTLRDAKDEILEVVSQKIGFRIIDIKDGQLLVNDQPIYGSAIIIMLKKSNFF
ncbi:MAG: beta-galactosidase/beta-glucuronidase [Saprospiraceae bacterium]|jgi:beta-galactosidase/beta-glucuronidase